MSADKTIFVTSLTGIYDPGTLRANQYDNLGDIRTTNGKVYKFISYDKGGGSVAAVAGNMSYYKITFDVTTSRAEMIYDVTGDLSDSCNVGAGMLMAVIPDGDYGWIQVKGPATLAQEPTAGADGNALTAVGADADGKLDVSGAYTDAICAYALDISEKYVLLDCPY